MEMDTLAKQYETGLITSNEFIKTLNALYPKATETDLIVAWNSILLDFPEYRLEFLEQLKEKGTYRMFLLSNTNDLHIQHVAQTMGKTRFERFKTCFEGFYLSHEIKMRKPNTEIYEHVLALNTLIPEETLFIDDTKENTDSANKMGIQCWNLQVGEQDIIELTQRL